MRSMEIPRFNRKIEEITDLDNLLRSRLGQGKVIWPEQAFAIIGYMSWPNDPDTREVSIRVVRAWFEGSQEMPAALRQIQTGWARVADIFNLHIDLSEGGHQARRGGASLGKAIELAAALSKA